MVCNGVGNGVHVESFDGVMLKRGVIRLPISGRTTRVAEYGFLKQQHAADIPGQNHMFPVHGEDRMISVRF